MMEEKRLTQHIQNIKPVRHRVGLHRSHSSQFDNLNVFFLLHVALFLQVRLILQCDIASLQTVTSSLIKSREECKNNIIVKL